MPVQRFDEIGRLFAAMSLKSAASLDAGLSVEEGGRLGSSKHAAIKSRISRSALRQRVL